MVIAIMGVTGSGKSTVGQLLATKLSLPFVDADSFHTQENIVKMGNGIELNDQDRIPWLTLISEDLFEKEKFSGVVLACSALKQQYRDILQIKLSSDIIWIHLAGSQQLILDRLKQRKNHFMSLELLNSQFDTLESPKNACNISIEKSPEEIVEEIIKEITK